MDTIATQQWSECMRRWQTIGLFFLGVLVLTLLLSVFFSQQKQQTRRQAAVPTPPLEGIYEDCAPSQGRVCWVSLKTIKQGGFRLVLNYKILAESDQITIPIQKLTKL